MIYSTNRTASLGEMSVDVNESYFGMGAYDFMAECAQDELALFEAGIKSDIDEVLIGESSYELEALNEGFIENAVNKIKELMRKFVEWLKSVTRSIIAKLTQLVVRDNEKFCKIARKQLYKMKNSSKFEYEGKALKLENTKMLLPTVNSVKGITHIEELYYNTILNSKETSIGTNKEAAKEQLEEFKKESNRDNFERDCVEDNARGGIKLVEAHLSFLESYGKKGISNLKKELKNLETKAKKLAKSADKLNNKDYKDDEFGKKKASVAAELANDYKTACQTFVSDSIYILKQSVKIARAVVTKGMGATPKDEGVEYTEELTDAMIESFEFEIDEAVEEMSEAKHYESDDIDDDLDDDKE